MVNDRYIIEIAGSVASGKTSLAKAFADKAPLVLEDLSTNPYISSSIENEGLQAFCTQMSFLTGKVYQRSHALQASPAMISDYSLYSEPGYQEFWTEKYPVLTPALLNSWRALRREIPKPDCIILLKTSVKEQRRRIQARGREFEQKLWTHANLGKLNRALTESFNDHVPETVPVITLRSADIDLNNPQQLNQIWEQITQTLERPQRRTPILRA